MDKIILEGYADDSLCLSSDNKLKTIRLINVINVYENLSLEIVSESEFGEHIFIDSMLGKKISIEVKILE